MYSNKKEMCLKKMQEGDPEQQIPRLIELAKLLLEWAAPKGTSYSNKQIKEKFRDKNIQRIFALLRVCAAYQHFCNHEAPWPKIDDELEKLKKKTQNTEMYIFLKKWQAKSISQWLYFQQTCKLSKG
ncbi:hypothetical protein BY996DRAFT_6419921 [Phakopsora pachyrhizi]|nr:hypothetical protein BY996DRAFT_6419921 [Phakopsora pachyrhizi]